MKLLILSLALFCIASAGAAEKITCSIDSGSSQSGYKGSPTARISVNDFDCKGVLTESGEVRTILTSIHTYAPAEADGLHSSIAVLQHDGYKGSPAFTATCECKVE